MANENDKTTAEFFDEIRATQKAKEAKAASETRTIESVFGRPPTSWQQLQSDTQNKGVQQK